MESTTRNRKSSSKLHVVTIITTFSSLFFFPQMSQRFFLSIFHSQIFLHSFDSNKLQHQQCRYRIPKPPMAVAVDRTISLFVISAAIVRSFSFRFAFHFSRLFSAYFCGCEASEKLLILFRYELRRIA